MIGDQIGARRSRARSRSRRGGYFADLQWSPDGKQLTAPGQSSNLWRSTSRPDARRRSTPTPTTTPGATFDAMWSPDSRWVAYSKSLDSHLRADLRLLARRRRSRTSSPTDWPTPSSPAFDASGKYLYFLASTDYGPRTGWLEMSSLDRPVRRAIYLAVLSATSRRRCCPSRVDEPTRPASGSAPAKPRSHGVRTAPPSATRSASATHVDIDGIEQRILALDVPAGDYSTLVAGPAGTVLLSEPRRDAGPAAAPRSSAISSRTDAAAHLPRRASRRTRCRPTRRSCSISARRRRVALGHRVAPTSRPRSATARSTSRSSRRWWIRAPSGRRSSASRGASQREFFYDAKMHGADWNAVYDEVRAAARVRAASRRPRLPHRADRRRADGRPLVSRRRRRRAAETAGAPSACSAPTTRSRTGTIASSASTRARIWNPELRAPLSAPGIQVAEGDYLLEVNGRPLAPPTNVYSAFRGDGRPADGASRQQHAVARKARGSSPSCRSPNEDGAAHARVDRGQSPQGRRAVGRTAGVRLAAEHRRRRATPPSRATSTRSRTRTARSSTSGTITAVRSPTTS